MADVLAFAALCACYQIRCDPATKDLETCSECPYWQGNGAREYLAERWYGGDFERTDRFLAELWAAGFKVVPVGDES